MKYTIALSQIDSVIGDAAANLRNHVTAVEKALQGGANLVVFPELSLSGYSLKDSNWDVAVRASDPKPFGKMLALSNDISILIGCVEESEEYGMYNSAFLLEKGIVTSVHRKMYPPTYGMFEELRYFSPGKRIRAFDSVVGRVGVLICEDVWHISLPYLLAHDGAKVIIGMAASPTRLSGNNARIQNAQVNTEQHKSYARLLSSYVVFCNRVGYEDGVNFWGGSEVIGPHGDIMVQAKLFDSDLVFAEIDENEIRRARRLSRHFLDEDMLLLQSELQRIIRQRHQ